MKIKKIAGTAAVAGAMSAAGLGLGAGSAQADRIWVPDIPGIPWGPGHWVDEWIPDPNLGLAGTDQECMVSLEPARSLDRRSARGPCLP